VEVAIEKGQVFVSVLTQNQRNYLLGTLLGLFIVDGEYDTINTMVQIVQRRVR
jgi:Trp operon repressor